MADVPSKLLKERERRIYTSDATFYRKLLYFFELRLPALSAPGGSSQTASFFFPLIINPQSYSMEEPFAVEATPTQGGGLYVEENGIIQRTIRLSGHTGFRPRPFPRGINGPLALKTESPEERSFGRRLRTNVLDAVSGQKHFHYLQDAVFRTYADYKRDPAKAADTVLIFHNPRDEESWQVAPVRFVLERTKDTRFLYSYEIELLVLDQAALVDKDFSEDKDLFATIRDAVIMVKSGINIVQGAVNDLVALAQEIQNVVQNFNQIIDGVTSVINAVSDFVEGVTDFIQLPLSTVSSLAETVDASLQVLFDLEEADQAVVNLPDQVWNKLRQIGDGLDRVLSHPEVFETQAQKELRRIKELQELQRSLSTERAEEARDEDPPSSLDDVNALGTNVTSGDVLSAEGELRIGGSVIAYTGVRKVAITNTDSLVSLAARYLGDARLWQHIAVLNGLKPPFLDEQAAKSLTSDEPAFPGAFGVGDSILIPSFTRANTELPLLPVLGARSDDSADVHLLGRDLKLEPVAGRPGAVLYDVPIDEQGGSVGPQLVEGTENLKQGLLSRLGIEKGTDILFQKVGVGRIIGTNFAPGDIEAARYKFIEAISQDTRVANVASIELRNDSGDSLLIEADVEVRGFAEPLSVQIPT